jgi:hypothetical protein
MSTLWPATVTSFRLSTTGDDLVVVAATHPDRKRPMIAQRQTVSPSILIILGAVALLVGVVGSMLHLRGYGVTRTGAQPLFTGMIGATMIIVGIAWSLM